MRSISDRAALREILSLRLASLYLSHTYLQVTNKPDDGEQDQDNEKDRKHFSASRESQYHFYLLSRETCQQK
jgi:hypothetical protein